MTIPQQFILDTLYKDNAYTKKQVTILINCISSNNEEKDNKLVYEMLTSLIVDYQIDDTEEENKENVPMQEVSRIPIDTTPSKTIYIASGKFGDIKAKGDLGCVTVRICESLTRALVLSLDIDDVQALELNKLVNKIFDYPNEFHEVPKCLLKYTFGYKSAIVVLSQYGFDIKCN